MELYLSFKILKTAPKNPFAAMRALSRVLLIRGF
jgi:hypothetical protein